MADGWPGRASRLCTPDASILKHLSIIVEYIICYIYNNVNSKISIDLYLIYIMHNITSNNDMNILFTISLMLVTYIYYNDV